MSLGEKFSSWGGAMRHVFISHASRDKSALSPLLSELVRRGIPIFIDQKMMVQWDEDVRDIAHNDLGRVQSIGSGSYEKVIHNYIRDCSVFVGLYSDNFFVQGKGCDLEIKRFRQLRTPEEPQYEPLIIQALPIRKPPSISTEHFFDEGQSKLNIEMLDPVYFQNGSAKSVVANRIEIAFRKSISDEIAAQKVELQRQSAEKFNGGVIECTCLLGPGNRASFTYLPGPTLANRGTYVSISPMTSDGSLAQEPIPLADVEALFPVLKSLGYQPVSAAFAGGMYLPMRDNTLMSPYGQSPRRIGDAIWAYDGTRIFAVRHDGTPISAERAFLYIERVTG